MRQEQRTMNPFQHVTHRNTDRPRLLLIGADGQLGWELSRTLQSLGQVIHTLRGNSGAPPDLELDLSRLETIRAVLRCVRPNLVINAAGYTDVEEAERHPDLPMLINGLALDVLASEARRQEAGLIHYS